jgi:RHS repeat-associated protein
VAGSLSLVLLASLLSVTDQRAAAEGGSPSVPLPSTPSQPVDPLAMAPRPVDQASSRALQGDQPAGGTPPGAGASAPTATSLSPSATWAVSPQTGGFSWSYPLRVPPAPGGLEPKLGLSYSSSTVDGRTSATNNQSPWLGDGWNLEPGFVERTYGACLYDSEGGTVPPRVGDLCWKSDNATAAYNGGGGVLVRDDATGTWRPKDDDGARIERLTAAGNGDNDGEYWKITTLDGTQYFYGSQPSANSTWTVPVFGDDVGEPCRQGTFATSHCVQAWRWNLDKVVDAHGNMILFSYDVETASYGRNLQDTPVPYVRGGTLRRVEYGMRAGGTPAARVEFTVADRCVPGSTCVQSRPQNWPDVPWSEQCAATCAGHYSPTFWSTKRLASVTTQVLRAGAYSDVDRWTFDHQFPDPGDGEKAGLWLKSITHTGLVGGSESLPAVTFEGRQMANRVGGAADGLSPVVRYRITGIVSEAGGALDVEYAASDCVPGVSMPANPESNTLRCFPVRWDRPGYGDRTDWFHKFVVASVTTSDRISSNLDQLVSYEYLDGAAWHYDTSEFTPSTKKTYNDFRGFGRVRVHTGRAADPAGPVEMVEHRYFRGMNGDRLPTGTRSVSVTDSEGGTHTDHDWLAGFELESTTFLGESSTEVTRGMTTPSWQGPTANRGELKAYLVRPGEKRTFTPLAAGGRRTTTVTTSYDTRGLPTEIDDAGDDSEQSDDLCTRITYAGNTSAWLWSQSRTQTVSARCSATPVFPDDAVSDTRSYFDGQAWGQAPTVGDVTKVEVLADHPQSGPVYATSSITSYDVHGRVLTSADALGRTTTTAYTPAEGGPTTSVVVTDPKNFVTTVTVDPAWGLPLTTTDPNNRITETGYDPLGRAVNVWLPDRPRSTQMTPNATFSYLVRRDAPTVVTSSTIGARGAYITSNVLYDGWYRVRQTQAPAVGGGRLLTDTRYDSHGRAYKATRPFFNDAPVDTNLWEAADTEIMAMTVTEFDGAGRVTASVFKAGAEEQWRTTTSYGGDRVHVDPPTGGTATTTITDARGRATALHQYRDGTPTGESDVTGYAYTPAGQLETLTDPAGNEWEYGYDLRGRQTSAEDPDTGASNAVYDDAGQLTSRTDARGQTLAYSYDELGRPTTVRADTTTGRLLARWTYDSVLRGKGKPATATSYDSAGNAYTRAVVQYTARYWPRQTSLTIPAAQGLLAGTYTTTRVFNPDGTLSSTNYPAAGGLFTEDVTHTYDDWGRPLTTRGGPSGSTVFYTSATDYTRYGEPQRVQLGSGTSRVWLSTYFDTGTRRVDRFIVDAEVSQPMQADLHYTYDQAGNITSIADIPQDLPADVQCFRMDHLGRLADAWTPARQDWDPDDGCAADPSVAGLTGPAPYWQTYTYDVTGNRRTNVQHVSGGDTTRTYSYPAAGQPRPHGVTSIQTATPGGTTTTTYTYDPAGNTETRGGQQLTWDERGHVATATTGGQATTFIYDSAGQRIIRRDPVSTTLYLDGQEIQLNRGTGALTGTRYYAHGQSTIAVRTNAGLTWLANDHHGSAHIAVNPATLTTSRQRTDPFGAVRGTPPASWPGQHGFVGGINDPTTGLTHIGARDYDPATGRFISPDPVLNPTDPQQLNAYTYANNSPVTHADPTGLYCDSCDYYAWTKGESSVWQGGHDVSANGGFCDPCNYHNPTGGWRSGGNDSNRYVPPKPKKPANTRPKVGGKPLPTIDELKVSAHTPLRPGETYIEGLTRWADYICQNDFGNAESEFCGAADEIGLTTHYEWWEIVLSTGSAILWLTPLKVPGPVGAASGATRSLATGAGEARFWSGIAGAEKTADAWAAKNGGATLNQTAAARGVKLPPWDPANPASVAAWKQVSGEFARGARGDIIVLQEDLVRVDSIWAEIEFPALKSNPNVTSITHIDPRTGATNLLWAR